MIVECESCHTRFRLAEERIPATGAKVRCSRCKTAFIVQRPGVSRDEMIGEVVAEATSPGASSAPEPTRDAFDMTGSATVTLGGSVEAAHSDDERSDEEKWEFDEEPRAGAVSPGAQKPSSGARKPAAPPDADDLDSLGSPEDWDLLGNGARRIAAEARYDAPSAPPAAKQTAPAPVEARVATSSQSVESALAAAVAAPAQSPTLNAPDWTQSLRDVAQSGVDGGVWFAAVAICAAGLALALSPQSEAVITQANPPVAVFETQPLALTVHALESAVGGGVLVVRGQLPQRKATNQRLRLRASWLDAQGAQIAGASAIAGPPLVHRKLRELSLERVRAEHEAHALELTAGGAFEAVFESLPEGAASLSLTTEREPAPVRETTQESEGSAGATTSSRPTLPLSSE